MTATMHCPVCGGGDTAVLVSLESVPVFCNVLHDTVDSARSAARAPFELRYCHTCTHAFNGAFDPALVEYSGAYENALHFSPTFREYADRLAQRLVADNDLHGQTVAEIGCGDGSFLEQLCSLGVRKGIGFDPSRPAEVVGPVTYVNDYFSEKYASISPDFVCCRHVLEHIAEPRDFVQSVGRTVRDRPRPGVYFEVPNSLYTLRDLGIWDLIYEHCSYFSPVSLRVLFEATGYRVVRLAEEYGGQFLGLDAVVEQARPSSEKAGPEETSALEGLARAFGAAHAETVSRWTDRLRQMADEQRRTVVWGAGSKAVTFLNVADSADCVREVVDVNPRKHGKFVSGSGQRIVSPADMEPGSVDVVLLMNPLYQEEVSAMLAERGVRCAIEVVK
ncbi:MAG: methyltransferase domain-containing protein [Chitinivibrionales bacterium]|nr:methyltransferase domain-containing protein [Chitinivibrionales bacterium]